MKNIVLLVFMCIAFVSCEYHNTDDCHQVLTFVNNTDRHLYISGNFAYPDTLSFKSDPNPKLDYAHNKVGAMSNNKVAFADRTCWETRINRSPVGVLMIYVFDGETLENTPWDTIKKNNMYLYRYDLRLENLEERGWQIAYDGE